MGSKHKFISGSLNVLTYLILLIFLVPVIWLILTSFKPKFEIHTFPPVLIPSKLTLKQYHTVFSYGSFGKSPFIHYFINSMVVSMSSTFIALLVGLCAGYSFAKFKFPAKYFFFFLILMIRAIPGIALSLPLYVLFTFLGWRDTLHGLIVSYIAVNIPFVVWLTEGFFREIPGEIRESAMVDGCSSLQAFLKIDLPLATPGLAVSSILIFILTWNEFPIALVLTSHAARTLPVGIFDFLRQFFVEWGPITAEATMMLVPVVIFSLIVQKHILRGLAFGALK